MGTDHWDYLLLLQASKLTLDWCVVLFLQLRIHNALISWHLEMTILVGTARCSIPRSTDIMRLFTYFPHRGAVQPFPVGYRGLTYATVALR